MALSQRALQATTRGLTRLADAVRSGGQPLTRSETADFTTAGQTAGTYVSNIFQSLALFRFFSFSMGATLIFVFNPGAQSEIVQFMFVVFVGLYNVGRVVWRFDPVSSRLALLWMSLGLDVAISVALVLLSGGLDSPFLIYSLTPVLTASLLMDSVKALVVALVSSLSVMGVHIAGGLGLSGFPWLVSGNYLANALLYLAVCVLIGYLPFLANLNWQRRVRSESLAG